MKNSYVRNICFIAASAALLFTAAGCRAKAIDQYVEESSVSTPISVIKVKYEDPTWNTGCLEYDPESTEKEPLSGSINGLKYQVISASASSAPDGKGYYILGTGEGEFPYKIFVQAGEKSTGGYSIEITDLKFDGTTLTVKVKETSPSSKDAVTQAITYPYCAVEMNMLPENTRVIGESGYEYEKLGTRLDAAMLTGDWIACFSDGAGEIFNKTYVYKTADGRYKYINSTATTVSWGSTKWKETVTGNGIVVTKEEIVEVAKKSGSCGYVMFPDDRKKPHTVAEFLKGNR